MKKFNKKLAMMALSKALPIILIPTIIISLLSAITYYITLDDAIKKEGDTSNTPNAASTYMSNVELEDDGTIKSKTTVDELWDEMIKNGSRVDQYLDSKEELARLMKAEIVTQYPDTRKNPDKEINWEDIISNGDEIQGIVKFKRTDSNNNTTTMTYVDQETFQGYIDEYNGTGSEKAKKNALSHFTLRKSKITSSYASGGGSSVDTSKLYFIGDSWIAGLQKSGVAETPYFYGQTGKSARNSEMSLTTIISNASGLNEASAIVLYLGVNDTSSYSEMNSLIDGLANKYSDKIIYVVEVTHVGQQYASSATMNANIDTYNEKVKTHCAEVSNAEFLEVASNMEDSNGWLETTNPDGLHLVGKEAYQKWYNSIISAIKGNGTSTSGSTTTNTSNNSSNKQTATVTKVDGDGYSEEYTSSAGITYKSYQQYMGSYSGNRYWTSNPNGTISSSGCGPTSVAILASGLVDPNITPAETAASMYERHRIYRCRIS